MKIYTAQDTIAEVTKMPRWLHSIDVGNGVTTPGHNNTWDDADRLRLPADMPGERLLDIGAADGFFSFLCEQTGAGRRRHRYHRGPACGGRGARV